MKSHGGCRYLFDHVVLFELKEVLNFAYVLRYIQETLLKFFHRLKSEVQISNTSCNCEAGSGMCNHAIELVYLLEHYRKLGLRSVPLLCPRQVCLKEWPG